MKVRRRKVLKALKKIEKLNDYIRSLQDICDHPEEEREYILRGSNGYYDPNDNSYWTSYFCKDCLKRWSISDQLDLTGTRVTDFTKIT